MTRWTVTVSPSVWASIREQVRHIAAHSVANALAWEARLDAETFALADLPVRSTDEDATGRLGYTVHKMTFERTYLVHYRIDDATAVVDVVGFRHGARQPGPGEP